MTLFTLAFWPRRVLRSGVVALTMLLTGCSAFLPAAVTPPRLFSLDDRTLATKPATGLPQPVARTARTLAIAAPRAAAGFDSRHIMYVRTPHQLEYFAHSDWVDTPARMIAPRIVSAIARGGAFRAVGPSASGMAGDWRLETELTRLQQEFATGPSTVRLTLSAYLLDNATNQVLASRVFDETEPAESDDPYGGVVAAGRVVQRVTEQLAAFCAGAAVTPPDR